MTVRDLLLFGNPVLRRVAAEIRDFDEASFQQTLVDLEDTLRNLQRIHGMGGGLAAPQIGSSMRVVYVKIRGRSFHLVNPEIVERSDEMFDVWDFCFSARAAFLALVERHRRITVEYRDIDGNPHTESLEGYFSELLQHEIDHLEGRLFVDRVDRPETITMVDEWDRSLATV